MIDIKENVSLKDKTTYHIGGAARFYCLIRNERQGVEALRWAHQREVAVFVLGNGSNVLISDRGINGLVIDMSLLTQILWREDIAICQAGAPINTLVRQCVDRGMAGLEELAGIPGSVGGAILMNAGAFNQTISDRVLWVEGIDRMSGSVVRREKKDITFSYRKSSFQNDAMIITGAAFDFLAGDRQQLETIFRDIIRKRADKQPLDLPNCGSVFRRPAGHYAGALIESCGLKGHRIGGAMISEKHANFIVNSDKACAEDVRTLIAHAQGLVYKQYGILLEPEVIFVGIFSTPLFKTL